MISIVEREIVFWLNCGFMGIGLFEIIVFFNEGVNGWVDLMKKGVLREIRMFVCFWKVT